MEPEAGKSCGGAYQVKKTSDGKAGPDAGTLERSQ